MPIRVGVPITVFDQEQFHALDREVMGIVFDVHNQFGRLMDEELYKQEIAARCIGIGLPVEREVRIRASHESFEKDYSMDLLVSHGFMLEAKTAERLVATHRGQSINYLLIAGMRHGRLINFRTERVEHKYVSTTLTVEERHQFTVEDNGWTGENDQSRFLKTKTIQLLEDWGAFLDVNLYREALIHFLGGAASVTRPVEIFSGSRVVGTQKLNMVTVDTAFAFTTLQGNRSGMREHLARLLAHTSLRHIQWINLDRHRVQFCTLSNNPPDNDRIMLGQNNKRPESFVL